MKKKPLGDGDEKAALHPDKEADGAVPNAQEDPAYDPAKVKFLNGEAQEVRVDVPDKDVEFEGLTKEELQKYANDPYWVKMRWILLILFWVAWVGMLVAAVLIIVFAPKCPPRQNLEWHEKGVLYDLYTRSFKDSDGDGVGDIKGIESKLDYLHSFLNTTGLIIGPVFASPMFDFGYDVSNFTELAPEYGTMADLKSLKTAMHKRDMKLIVDFIPNHTSKMCKWFQESKKGTDPYRDFYVWHPGKSGSPPNNWVNVYGGPAWTFDNERKEYYLHQFFPEQPDLNLTNPKVLSELEGILEFWMSKGVDGFRVDAAAYLVEEDNLADEPKSAKGQAGTVTKDDYDYLDHIYTKFQPGSYDLITQWRELIDNYDIETKRVLIAETYGPTNKSAGFYEYGSKLGANIPTNNLLLSMNKDCRGLCVRNLVHEWINGKPAMYRSNWALGNRDYSRVASRMGEKMVNAMNMLLLTLPGTPTTYYGEEIGMIDGDLTFDETKDPAGKNLGQANYKKGSRDPERTPMQWDGSKSAGFSDLSNATAAWLPVNPNYHTLNVQAQRADGGGHTSVEVYAQISTLRQQPSLQWGSFRFAYITDEILSFVRQAEGFDAYLVAINFGQHAATANFQTSLDDVPSRGQIVATTANFDSVYRQNDYKIGNTISLGKVHIRPGEGIVVKWAHDAVEQEKHSQ
eukprot:GHVU01213502.1.p1 GENE.GHVU01213502.1~~GHVU01213502.1.p1  ORF type:complete len:684 (+),score=114.73 GHVU01213502.1:88-2139(+)